MERKQYEGDGVKYTSTSYDRSREASNRPLETHNQAMEQDYGDMKLPPSEFAVNASGRNESIPSSPVDATPIDPILTSLAATAYSPRARAGSLDLLAQALEPSPHAAARPEAHISSTGGTFANCVHSQYGYNEFQMDHYPPEPPRSIDIPTINPAGGTSLEQPLLLPATSQMPPWHEQSASATDQIGNYGQPAYFKPPTVFSNDHQSFPSSFPSMVREERTAGMVQSVSQNPPAPPPSRRLQGEAYTDLSTTEAPREDLIPPAHPIPLQPPHYHHHPPAPAIFQTDSAEGRRARAMFQRQSVLALAERIFTKRQIREMHAEADRLTAIYRREAGLEPAGREDDDDGSSGNADRGRAGAARSSGAVSRRGGRSSRSSSKRSRYR